MADVLIGAPATHPSKELLAGQVVGFANPAGSVICTYCGYRYDNLTFHPNWGGGGGGLPDHLLTFGGDPVTYAGDYVTYG